MAENAANFTTTVQQKPSIFEVIAQQSLDATLYPALQKVALLLSTNFPQKCKFLNDYYDEIFVAINGVLQYYYLKHFDASFSENFYGLKRIVCDNKSLSIKEKNLSLIFLVIIPYLHRKLTEKFQIYRLENADGCLRHNLEGNAKKLVIYSYSTFEVIKGLLTVANYIRYMAEKTPYQLPLLHLINIKLTYANEVESSVNFWGTLLKGNLKLSDLNFGLVQNAITSIIECVAFFLQFLHAWNIQKPNFSIMSLPKVEAPSFDIRAKNYQGKCPICFRTWIIPTVLPVSGYIFCFRCILKYLNEKQKCPVTNLPANPLSIVRLYGA